MRAAVATSSSKLTPVDSIEAVIATLTTAIKKSKTIITTIDAHATVYLASLANRELLRGNNLDLAYQVIRSLLNYMICFFLTKSK